MVLDGPPGTIAARLREQMARGRRGLRRRLRRVFRAQAPRACRPASSAFDPLPRVVLIPGSARSAPATTRGPRRSRATSRRTRWRSRRASRDGQLRGADRRASCSTWSTSPCSTPSSRARRGPARGRRRARSPAPRAPSARGIARGAARRGLPRRGHRPAGRAPRRAGGGAAARVSGTRSWRCRSTSPTQRPWRGLRGRRPRLGRRRPGRRQRRHRPRVAADPSWTSKPSGGWSGSTSRGRCWCSREAARLFEQQGTGGDIVLVSTKNVFAPGANFGAYSATKAAAHQLARIASLELAADRRARQHGRARRGLRRRRRAAPGCGPRSGPTG